VASTAGMNTVENKINLALYMGFCNVWLFGNICTCIYCVFTLFRLCIFILICYYCNLNFLEPSGPLQVCNGTAIPFTVRTTATE
jgi:hypothetical protein